LAIRVACTGGAISGGWLPVRSTHAGQLIVSPGCSLIDQPKGKQLKWFSTIKFPPWHFRKIHIHHQVIGIGIDADKVRKAIQLSEEKYCSMYAKLKAAIEIAHDFEI
jgi:hypothetical protein